jgi:hypothetical protein
MAFRAMTRALLVEPGSLLVLPAGHELEVMRVDTARQPARVVRLVVGRDPTAVVDLPHDLVAAADLLSHPHKRVAVLIESSLVTPAALRRLDTIVQEFFPDGHTANLSRRTAG